ncbi:hypothetical protein P1N98_16250, partial [Tsukamurella tyrosinosolvens]
QVALAWVLAQGDDIVPIPGTLSALDRLNHNQGGDPALLAQTLVEVAAMPDPPTRLYLGKDALHAILRATEAEHADAERYAELSRSISH